MDRSKFTPETSAAGLPPAVCDALALLARPMPTEGNAFENGEARYAALLEVLGWAAAAAIEGDAQRLTYDTAYDRFFEVAPTLHPRMESVDEATADAFGRFVYGKHVCEKAGKGYGAVAFQVGGAFLALEEKPRPGVADARLLLAMATVLLRANKPEKVRASKRSKPFAQVLPGARCD